MGIKGKPLAAILLLFLLLSCGACAGVPVVSVPPTLEIVEPLAAPAGTPSVEITLHVENPGDDIPADFLGLSFDAPALAKTYFDVENRQLANLLTNLGNGVLCFGAQGAEKTYWSRNLLDRLLWRIRFWGAQAMLTPDDLDRMFAFAKETGWKVMFVLNLGANDPEMAADIASYAAGAAGGSLLAFEVGNEPDLYYRNGLRPPEYSYTDYRKEYAAYRLALRRRLPDAPIAGPVTASTFSWFSNFLRDEAGAIVLATNHHYPLNAYPSVAPKDENYASIENLLSPRTMTRSVDLIRRFQAASRESGVPLRISETNSSYPAKDGLGDVFASALWGADYLFNLAESGVSGANFFSLFSCGGYTPICVDWRDRYHAQPLYYGLLLFHTAAQGRIVPAEVKTTLNVTTHAALAGDGTLRAVIINKTVNQAISAKIAPGGSYTGAGVFRLQAGAVDAKIGVTFAGSSVNEDGRWYPRVEEKANKNGDVYKVAVPPASAVLVTFKQIVR